MNKLPWFGLRILREAISSQPQTTGVHWAVEGQIPLDPRTMRRFSLARACWEKKKTSIALQVPGNEISTT